MSTELLSLSGKKEDGNNCLDVTSFYGGDREKCIQLTLDHDYIQLERADIVDLVEALSEWLK